MTRNAIAALLLTLASWVSGAAHGQTASPEINFLAAREGEFILVEARADLAVTQATAWAVLTDYESYPRFISSMQESKVVLRNAAGAIVEQKGSFGFLFFSQAIEVRMLVTEFAPNLIASRSNGGSFIDAHGRYELQTLDGGVRVLYTGRFLPEFHLPPLIGMSIVRYALRRNFTEMVDEILRRQAIARQPAKAALAYDSPAI